MELLVVFGMLALLAAWPSGRSQFRHWRGPTCATLEEVQREHLELYFPEAADRGEGCQ